MAEYIIQGETLSSIADAIRTRTGKEGEITATEMETEILDGTESFEKYKGLFDGEMTEFKDDRLTAIKSRALSYLPNLTTVDCPNVEELGDCTFDEDTNLVTVNLPKLKTVGYNVFSNCTSLVTVNLPKLKTVGYNVFSNCTSLVTVNLPKLKTVGCNVFSNCTSLETIDISNVIFEDNSGSSYDDANRYMFSNCNSLKTVTISSENTRIPYGCFSGCDSLSELLGVENITKLEGAVFSSAGIKEITDEIFPNLKEIGNSCFQYNDSIRKIDCSKVETVYSFAFYTCKNLTSVNLPSCTAICNENGEGVDIHAFEEDGLLTDVNLPLLSIIPQHCFFDCSMLQTLDLPSATVIYAYAFAYSGLSTLILRKDKKVGLNLTNSFRGTPIVTAGNGYVYVPRFLIEEYEADTVWQGFNTSKFRAIEDYPDICGTYPCESLTLSANTLLFESTDPQTIEAIREPLRCTEYCTWISSDETLVTVKNGVVTPTTGRTGTVTITATVGEMTASCEVTLNIPITYYTVTNELTNATTSNEVTEVEEFTGYQAILTFEETCGYVLTITMGGEDITSSVYVDGTINIPSVTGDIVITVTPDDNLIILSECTSGFQMPNGQLVTEGVNLITPFIDVTPSTTFKTNLCRYLNDGSTCWNQCCFYYDSDQNYISSSQFGSNVDYGTMSDFTLPDTAEYIRIVFHVNNDNPYFGLIGKLQNANI